MSNNEMSSFKITKNLNEWEEMELYLELLAVSFKTSLQRASGYCTSSAFEVGPKES